ncbi:MAG TPA: hypothetical protein VFV67_16765 [Actinophytocola sp.]|uniref:hypothetical protein n=1 Tax=Actinophytocola sp. TaxID=1872138 RepID=UPI002DBCE578|nr:hypothetical protein [Actinophytocola sp.]HEU5472306.1 hypothetical protein [Actinophytocola sp.]
MSTEPGQRPAPRRSGRTEATTQPASDTALAAGPPPATERRARTWVGLLLLVAGAFLAGDTVDRVALAWAFVAAWWPWALLVLAAANLIRSVLRPESLLAPGLVAFAALTVLAFRYDLATGKLVNVILPAALALAGIALLLSVGSSAGGSWTRILLTGRVNAPPTMGDAPLRPRAILGEVRANLHTAAGLAPVKVHATAIFGHVYLSIPADWHVILADDDGRLLTPIRDPRPNGDPANRKVSLRVLGFCGIVTVYRTA